LDNPQCTMGYDLELEKEFLDSQEVDFIEVKASKYKRKEKIPFREKFLAEPYRGLICGILTEISGRSGGGKTAFCIEATLSTLITDPSYITIYISTEAPFPSDRLHQMMRGQSDRAITDRILTESCDYLEAFSILLNNRIQLIIDKVKSESKKVKLIVIDSITALLRPEFEKSENIEKTKTLADIALKLKQIAQREKISILLVNQVSDNIDESAFSIENKARSAKPALGLFWRNLIDEAFLIEKFEDSKRTIEVTKSFRLSDTPIEFEITQYGLEGLQK